VRERVEQVRIVVESAGDTGEEEGKGDDDDR
jgi:hypothetical protein